MPDGRLLFDEEHDAFRDSFAMFLRRDGLSATSTDELFRRAGEAGFVGMQIAEQHGGGGVDDVRFCVAAVEELTNAQRIGQAMAYAMSVGVGIPLIARLADSEARKAWLPQVACGAQTVAVIDTTVDATVDGDGIRLNGAAPCVVNAQGAGLFAVATRSPGGEETVALVEAGNRRQIRIEGTEHIGMDLAGLADVHLDDLFVSSSYLLQADAVQQLELDQRLLLAVVGLAGARTAIEWTLHYVRERNVFGRALGSFENTRFVLADLLADIAIVGGFVDRALQDRTTGNLTASTAAAANLRASELYGRAADAGLQLHGGYGYMREYPISQAFADSRFLRLHAGSSGAMKSVIAQSAGL